jgi:mRNA-degrading endonuclease RelE of RelBE toxin-antitoxin system
MQRIGTTLNAPAWGMNSSKRFLRCSMQFKPTPSYIVAGIQLKNIRWWYPKRFPYRVIYEVVEEEKLVIIAAVIHAARYDRVWRTRI